MKIPTTITLFAILSLLTLSSNAQSILCAGMTNDENASENVKFELEIKKDKTPSFKDFGPFYKSTLKFFYSTGRIFNGADISDKMSQRPNRVVFTGSLPEKRNLTLNYNANGELEGGIVNYDTKIMNQPVQCTQSGLKVSPGACPANQDQNRALLNAIKNSNDMALIENAIECGADVNKADRKGCTPIMFAVDPTCGENNSISYSSSFRKTALLIDTLAANGAFVNVADKKGETPLIKAAKLNVKDVYDTFISLEAEFDAQDELGNTALMYAVQNGDAWPVEQLMEGNPDRSLKNKSGRTAYDIAKRRSKEDIMDLVRIADTSVEIQGMEDGTCSPLQINLKQGQVVDFTLKATDKMFKLDSQPLGLDLMADRNSTDKRTFSADTSGEFKFTCGFHGAGTPSEGTIVVQ